MITHRANDNFCNLANELTDLREQVKEHLRQMPGQLLNIRQLDNDWTCLRILNDRVGQLLAFDSRGNRTFFESIITEMKALFDGLPVTFGTIPSLDQVIQDVHMTLSIQRCTEKVWNMQGFQKTSVSKPGDAKEEDPQPAPKYDSFICVLDEMDTFVSSLRKKDPTSTSTSELERLKEEATSLSERFLILRNNPALKQDYLIARKYYRHFNNTVWMYMQRFQRAPTDKTEQKEQQSTSDHITDAAMHGEQYLIHMLLPESRTNADAVAELVRFLSNRNAYAHLHKFDDNQSACKQCHADEKDASTDEENLSELEKLNRKITGFIRSLNEIDGVDRCCFLAKGEEYEELHKEIQALVGVEYFLRTRLLPEYWMLRLQMEYFTEKYYRDDTNYLQHMKKENRHDY